MNVAKTPLTAAAVFGTLLMAAAVVVLPARVFADGPPATPPAPPAATPSAPRALPGTIAPDFALRSLDGSTVKLSDFRGKAVILNFWATWCAPCRDEIPRLGEISSALKADGLEVLGVAMDASDKRGGVEPYVRDMRIPYTILFGDDSVAAAYDGVSLLPQTFFIGRDGRIVGSLAGGRSKNELQLGARRALRTPMPSGSAPNN